MVTAVQLDVALRKIAQRTGEDGGWVVGGSAGLALRGLALQQPPRDLDIYADEADAQAIHRLLEPYAVDCQQESRTERYRSILSHYEIEGVPVELVGGFEVRAHGSFYRIEVQELLIPFGLVTAGSPIRIAPLAHELWFNVLRDREDRLQQIGGAMARMHKLHYPAFEEIVRRNALAPEQVKRAADWIGLRLPQEQA